MNTKIKILTMILAVFAAFANASFYADCIYTKYNVMGLGWGSADDYIMAGEFSGFTPTHSVLKFDISGYTEPVTRPIYLKFEKYTAQSQMFDNTSAQNPITISVRAALSDVEGWTQLETSEISSVVYDLIEIGDDGFYYLEVTDIVNDWITTGNNYGVVLVPETVPSGNSFTYIYGMGNSEGAAPVLTAVGKHPYYALPWLPNWTEQQGYTLQSWSFLPVEGEEPDSPLAADVYNHNTYGQAEVEWTNHGGGMVGWQSSIMGAHPDWAIGSYGGMVSMSGGYFDLSANIPTGETEGTVKVFIQYDWYAYQGSNISATVEDGIDITPQNYYSYEIGRSGSNHPWMRSTQIFELSSNTGNVNISLDATGFVTAIDSLNVVTAIDAFLPNEPLRHDFDYNLDGVIGLADFAIFSQSWLEESVYGFWH